MRKKMRKFADGGVTEGQNTNIDDDVRSRAMKFVENASEESRDIGEPITKSASTSSNKTTISKTASPPTKPKAESADEYKTRMEDLTKKQALERVEPEDYVPGMGLLKGMLKRGIKTAEKAVAKTPDEMMKVHKSTRGMKSEEIVKPEESLKSKVKTPREMMKVHKSTRGMKSGGSVSSASRRADGCAVRGKTRA